MSAARKPTEEQQEVIDCREGVAVVSACPGSGKTTTLALRAAALPTSETKLVMAFNKRAATEFAERMGQVPGADVRTFHSFCMREMFANAKVMGYSSKPQLLKESLAYQYGAALGVDPRARTWEAMQLDEDLIQTADHGMYDADVVKAMNDPESELAHNTYRAILAYRKWLVKIGGMTFDSMIRTVAENTNVLRNFGKHVMIDEYQDVDRFQFDIVTALGAHENTKSLVVVGDPNQRIYEWRGALSDAFGSMRESLPTARQLALSINFRSFHEIVAEGEKICPIGVTAARGWSEGRDAVTTVDPSLEQMDVVRMLGPDLPRSAILCRYNRNCLQWQASLAKQGIPVYVMGGGQYWNIRHVKIIMRFKELGRNAGDLFTSGEWQKCMKYKAYEDEKKQEEAAKDAEWLLSLSMSEIDALKHCLQNEQKGLRIATIHKVKGLEFEKVLLSGVDERLQKETFVYYVAVTRARNKLYLC